MTLDPQLRTMLVCPGCRGELVDVEGGLLCPAEAVLYPVVDGVPHLIAERSRSLTAEQVANLTDAAPSKR